MSNDKLKESDRRVRLSDGRWLGYAEYGDPGGRPLLSFHGGLSCRLDAAFASPACREGRVRLISVDRPGVGISDDQPGRTILDWPNDVAQLAKALQLERFAVLGWSAGGPFALSCGYALPEQVTRVGIVGGMAPVDDRPGAIDELGLLLDRILLRLVFRSPRAAALLLRGSRRLPRWLMKRALLHDVKAPADRALIELFGPDELAMFYEGLRPGPAGALQEYRILAGPWGTWLPQLKTEVHLWQGEDDRLVPQTNARALAARLPRAHLHLVPGQGHFLLRNHLGDVLSVLMGNKEGEG